MESSIGLLSVPLPSLWLHQRQGLDESVLAVVDELTKAFAVCISTPSDANVDKLLDILSSMPSTLDVSQHAALLHYAKRCLQLVEDKLLSPILQEPLLRLLKDHVATLTPVDVAPIQRRSSFQSQRTTLKTQPSLTRVKLKPSTIRSATATGSKHQVHPVKVKSLSLSKRLDAVHQQQQPIETPSGLFAAPAYAERSKASSKRDRHGSAGTRRVFPTEEAAIQHVIVKRAQGEIDFVYFNHSDKPSQEMYSLEPVAQVDVDPGRHVILSTSG
jgi:hypothetical protein